MQFIVNGRFTAQRVTGMQRYAHELTSRLTDHLAVRSPRHWGRGMRGHMWEQGALGYGLGSSLLWSPCSTGPLTVERQVVTIHDCAFIDHPECFSPTFARWYQWLVPRLARRVRQIITVSSFSRDQICEYFNLPSEKVRVILSGVDRRFVPAAPTNVAEVRARLGLPDRYVLCVASLEPRKNLLRLLDAWSRLPHEKLGLSLVLAGAKGAVFRDIGLDKQPPAVVLPGYVPDADLPALYSGAQFFVLPSIYEGFGLPVLEAMACGTPVMCSGVTSLPEVAGDAARFVDPFDVESIGAGIMEMAENEDLRAELRAKGLVHATKFDWEQTARDTLETLRMAA